jgi:hypothetical protein
VNELTEGDVTRGRVSHFCFLLKRGIEWHIDRIEFRASSSRKIQFILIPLFLKKKLKIHCVTQRLIIISVEDFRFSNQIKAI